MKKNKQQTSFVNIGTSLLLVIFLVLTLVTFAVLSLTSARSDYNLSTRLASHKTEYYKASETAETIVDEIDRILKELSKKNGADLAAYRAEAELTLQQTVLEDTSLRWDSDTDTDTPTLSFTVPMSESQALEVVLRITDYTNCETYYTIHSWNVISTDTWEGDQSIQLLPMED